MSHSFWTVPSSRPISCPVGLLIILCLGTCVRGYCGVISCLSQCSEVAAIIYTGEQWRRSWDAACGARVECGEGRHTSRLEIR